MLLPSAPKPEAIFLSLFSATKPCPHERITETDPDSKYLCYRKLEVPYLSAQPPPSGRCLPREAWHRTPDHQISLRIFSSETNNHISVYTHPRTDTIQARALSARWTCLTRWCAAASPAQPAPATATFFRWDSLPYRGKPLPGRRSLCGGSGTGGGGRAEAAGLRRRRSRTRTFLPRESSGPESRRATGLVVPARYSTVCPMHERTSVFHLSFSDVLHFCPLSYQVSAVKPTIEMSKYKILYKISKTII
jgi:hypothetical protein